MTRKSCTLRYDHGQDVVSFSGRLADLVSVSGEEFVVVENGERIRLDHIVDLDGVSFRD